MKQIHQIAKDISENVKEDGSVPFIAFAGTPGAGKSFLCKNLQQILKKKYDLNPLVIGMDGYHYYRKELDQFEDPEEAHARRGAEFTFNGERFVKDISEAKQKGEGSFPSFDHAKKDPEENKINFDKNEHKIVLVEGLYVLLSKKPWAELSTTFDKSYFIEADLDLTKERL